VISLEPCYKCQGKLKVISAQDVPESDEVVYWVRCTQCGEEDVY